MSGRLARLCAPPFPFELAGAAASEVLPQGADIYRQDDPSPNIYVIAEGWAFTYILLENGRRQVLDFAIRGSVLGLPLRPGLPMAHGAECATRTRVTIHPTRQIAARLRERPQLMERLLEIKDAQEARATDHLVNVCQRDARGRLAHLMMELYYRLRRQVPDRAGETIPFPLTLPQIGDAIGLTGVHVSRTFRVLRDEQVCRVTNRRLCILDPAALARLAGFAPLEGPALEQGPRADQSADQGAEVPMPRPSRPAAKPLPAAPSSSYR